VVAQGRFAHTGGLARLSARDAAAVDAALDDTDARHLAARPFTAISAGEQQRVLLARALATGAEVILMDEPTAALDVGHALALLALVRRLAAAGRAIAVVLHSLDEVRRVADRAILLDRGRTMSHGPVSEVLSAEPLGRVFGVSPVPGGALGFALVDQPCA
jgi:iron complex transport system ATP-binding protein